MKFFSSSSILTFLFYLLTTVEIFDANDTINTNQVIRDGDTIVSSAQSFKLGFFSPGNSTNRYVGIWYMRNITLTPVWVANRESPLRRRNSTSGLLTFNPSGQLVILDESNNNTTIWSSNTSRVAQNPVVQLLDSGNLVVRESNDDRPEYYLWQSFDYPTNTIIQGMDFGWNLVTRHERYLSSWTSADDPGPGDYTFRMDITGYPQVFTRRGDKVLSRIGPWNGMHFSGVPMVQNPSITSGLFLNSSEVYYRTNNDRLVVSRITLGPSGVLNRWTWDNRTHEWQSYYNMPADACDSYGFCGAHGSCNLANRPVCGCLERFVPRDEYAWSNTSDWSGGCVRRTAFDCTDDVFLRYSVYKMPDSRLTWFNENLSLEECKAVCLRNCSCTAYSNLDIRNGGSGCLVWFGDLVDMRELSGSDMEIHIRMAASESANISTLSRPNCETACGDVTIPFPFGTTSNCVHDHSFHITCNHDYNPPKPFFSASSVEILEISLVDGLVRIASSVASDCYDHSGSQLSTTISELALSSQFFTVSSMRNRFTAVGCDTYALVEGSSPGWKQMSAGCVSWCDDNIGGMKNGSCSGIGCCQTSIPGGVSDFLVEIRSFRNHTGVRGFNPCGYAFVAEDGAYEFRASHLMDLGSRNSVPVVLEWSMGNVSCREAAAQGNFLGIGCAANHSECVDSSNGVVGYRCKCLAGFEGNPYLVDGCKGINECESPDGFGGDGKKDGSGCHGKARDANHNNGSNASLFYIASGFMIPAIGSSWIFWRRKQNKVVKLRQNLFIRNGGKLLQVMGGQKTLTIFTADELEKATNNYDENNIIHRDQDHNRWSVYLGTIMSTDGANREVTIHKCGEVTSDEYFISRIISLSRMNHKNVVRPIGCCLETPSPLLVQEFITIKTLYDHIHDNVLSNWDVCLRIAADTAGALAYLHSSASEVPINHGNLSSSGILLHNRYTVKLCDFALTRPVSCSAGYYVCARAGYMDPEYMFSGRLTEKCDVYSFGVVLAELLTGKDAISHEGHLAECFVSSIRDNKLDRILDERMDTVGKIEMLTRVGKVAEKCLSVSSVDRRPTMKEVAIELENIIATNSDSGSKTISSRGAMARRVVRRNRSL